MAQLDASNDDMTKSVIAALEEDNDLKKAFCECWPCLKRLLQLLAARVSAALKLIIEKAIALGDKVHASVCG
jgi:hypothetical protein